MTKTLTSILAALVLFLSPLAISGAKAAEVISLSDFIEGSGPDLDLKLDIGVAADVATFTFINDSPVPSTADTSSIFTVYFEQGLSSLLGAVSGAANGTATPAASVVFDGGVGEGVAPPNPPGVGDWTGNYAAWGKVGPAANGVNPGEEWAIAFLLDSLATTAGDIASAILAENSTSRVFAHVGDCFNEESCTVGAVPVPAAIWLLLSGVVGLFGIGILRRTESMSAA